MKPEPKLPRKSRNLHFVIQGNEGYPMEAWRCEICGRRNLERQCEQCGFIPAASVGRNPDSHAFRSYRRWKMREYAWIRRRRRDARNMALLMLGILLFTALLAFLLNFEYWIKAALP